MLRSTYGRNKNTQKRNQETKEGEDKVIITNVSCVSISKEKMPQVLLAAFVVTIFLVGCETILTDDGPL